MTEDIGLVITVKTIGESGATNKLGNDIADQTSKGVSTGVSKGLDLAKVRLPGFAGSFQASLLRAMSMFNSQGAAMAQRSMDGFSSLQGSAMQAMAKSMRKSANESVFGFTHASLGQTPGLVAPAPPTGGGGGGGGGGVLSFLGGGGGGAGALMGVAAAGVIVLQGILSAVQKVVSILSEASPILKNQLKLLNTGFMMILRPLGDALGMLLRPISLFFRSMGQDMLKQLAAKTKELKSEGLSGAALGDALFASYPQILFDAISNQISKIDWATTLAQIGTVIVINFTQTVPSMIADVCGKLADGIVSTIKNMLQWVYDTSTAFWTQTLPSALGGLGTWLWNTITGAIGDIGKAIGSFGSWLWTHISDAIGDIASAIGNGAGSFAVWLWNSIVTAIGDLANILGQFGTWLWNGIIGAIGALGDFIGGLGTWLWNGITGAIGDMASAIGGGFSSFGAWLWNGITSAIGDIGSALGDLGNFLWKQIHNAIAGAINSIHDFSFSVLGQTIKPFTAVPTIAYLASGGITNGPMPAIVGDNPGGKEVISPLSDLKSMIVEAVQSASGRGGGEQSTELVLVIPGDALARAIDNRTDLYVRKKVMLR